MTTSRNIALLVVTLVALAAPVAASAQGADTRIVVIGAINNPAHMQPVTDNRDAAVPEMPVVYDNQVQPAPAPAQSAPTSANQTPAQPASTGRADLGQAVKSQ